MVVNFERMDIVIVTHNRSAMLQELALAWAATAPTYHAMRIITYNPAGVAAFKPLPRCEVARLWWPPEHVGCMAKMWNLAMIWAFRDPEVEWLLCSMDDTEVSAGWPELLASRDADLYLAPASDLCFLLNRRALRLAGWFDERFPVIGYQDWDWEARAVRALGACRVVVEDQHGWVVNPIGLSAFWRHAGGGATPTTRDMRHQHQARAWLEEKWGNDASHGADFWNRAMAGPGPKVPEVEWYPWFDRGKEPEHGNAG